MKIEGIRSKLEDNKVLPIGTRGTSYEMVVCLFENGVLTGNEKEAKKRDGVHIYFWPIRENWEANGLTPPIPWDEYYWDPVEWSQRFAKIAARKDYFEPRTGFRKGEYEGWANPSERTQKKVRDSMQQRGLTDSDIADLIAETERREGYILEFHPDLERDFRIEPDAWFGNDHTVAFQVDCPSGIDLKYISKITPIGDRDMELISKYLRGKESNTS